MGPVDGTEWLLWCFLGLAKLGCEDDRQLDAARLYMKAIVHEERTSFKIIGGCTLHTSPSTRDCCNGWSSVLS
ncbi:hypothetical protein CEXT_176271 [Caerostris extrusa]|uniref:Uncharacterized protein n=1 Tax=Caerostris extrusa TaxID=172846 RepID=A0AAV4NQG2_CAEEX|nr:hypothetical protein CEXT_176271 [Caerostris extrusa]